MEKFIKTTKIKLLVMVIATLVPVLFFIVFFDMLSKNLPITGAVKVLRYVIFIFFEVVIVYKIFTYLKVLNDPQKAEKELIKRSDERINFLKNKIFSFEYKLVLYIHSLALFISGFISDEIFYTLLVSIIFMLISAQIVKIYYHKKY